MTEKPAPKTTNEVFTPIRDLPSAPIIFFEFCPTLGNHNGLINIMLAAGIVMPSGGPGTDVVPVAVAHLRCTAAAAIQLRDAIDKALLIGAPVQNPEARRTDAGTTLSPSRRKNTSGACAKAIGSRRR